MVIERFKNRDAEAVYAASGARTNGPGRTLLHRELGGEQTSIAAFQLMACDDPKLLEQWAVHWRDLVDFEFVPVRPSREAAELISPGL